MKKLLSISNNDKLIYLIIVFFPLSFVVGNLMINTLIFLSLISFFLNFKENIKLLDDKINYFLIFFFITALINLYFSQYPVNSYQRVLKILLLIFFVIEFRRLFQIISNTNFIFIIKSWSLIFLIIAVDVIFEINFGFNTIGNFTTLEGRISSFFGDELVAGAFFYSFGLIFISYLITIKTNHLVIAIIIVGMIIVSFLIGERSNFIRFFSIASIFYFIILKINLTQKFLILLTLLLSIFTVLNLNEEYKYRYVDQIGSLYKINGIVDYFKHSKYGAHQNTAYQILINHPIFGVGIKNFRIESSNEEYENKEYSETAHRQSTHPHQIHLEILSETGLFGYFTFLIFITSTIIFSIKNYLYSRNYFQLSSILYIISSLYPILPSGSFYSTFSGGLFWFNFALMVSFIRIKNLN
jgi:O-antigen ligase